MPFDSIGLQFASNSRFDLERLLVKRSLAERWGQKEGEKTALLVFLPPFFCQALWSGSARFKPRIAASLVTSEATVLTS